ncbi:MAG: hypothetical protein KAI55_04530 [Candidatus Aenigmarchaeota archaeon]|nr:hypothetical protein [Candidatus Aenigmarchaeota archaeon]
MEKTKKANMAINKMMLLLLALIVLVVMIIMVSMLNNTGNEMIQEHITSLIPK